MSTGECDLDGSKSTQNGTRWLSRGLRRALGELALLCHRVTVLKTGIEQGTR